MENPIPRQVRLWLYLLGALALTVATTGVVPAPWLNMVIAAAAALNVLAAANVPGPPTEVTTGEVIQSPDLGADL